MKSRSFDRVLLYALLFIVVVLAVAFLRKELKAPVVAYVEIGKLVDNYRLKADLEKGSETELLRIKTIVDSLKMIKRIEGNQITRTDSQIVYAESAFHKYYEISNREITKKIWERLNPLMIEYGNEKNLELLIGANGAGTILYGSKSRDVTDDLIKFINTNYEKGN